QAYFRSVRTSELGKDVQSATTRGIREMRIAYPISSILLPAKTLCALVAKRAIAVGNKHLECSSHVEGYLMGIRYQQAQCSRAVDLEGLDIERNAISEQLRWQRARQDGEEALTVIDQND